MEKKKKKDGKEEKHLQIYKFIIHVWIFNK